MILPILFPLLLYVPFILAQSNSTCYLLNGNPLPNIGTFFPGFAPCTAPGLTSICCATNRTGEPGGDASGDIKDECMPNGLCRNRNRKQGVETVAYFANHCTDPTYPTGKCLDICPSNRGTGGSSRVTPCTGQADSEMWCCGEKRDCCDTEVGVVRLAKVLGQASPSLSSSVVMVSSSTSMLVTSASATSTMGVIGVGSSESGQSTKKQRVLKAGAIAGIIVGVVALLSLIVAAVVLKKRKAKPKPDALLNSAADVPPPQYQVVEHRIEKDSRGLAELETPISELPGVEARSAARSSPHVKSAELDAGNVRRES